MEKIIYTCVGLYVVPLYYRIHFVSSVQPDSLTADYATVEQAQKETGLKFHCPTTLGNDFTFMNMNVNDGEYFDENGDSFGTYQPFLSAT